MTDSEERIEERPAGPAPGGEGGEAVSGPEAIARYVKHLGGGPGVYRMMDKAGEVIYVGKARNLKNRVQNYGRLGGHTNRIAAMIRSTVTMEFVNTSTEAEALLLEANLIKRFKPRYNVSFRDDKSFPYIVIRRDQEAPQIAKHRGARSLKGDYFGPFASAGAVNRTLNTLQRAFLLRSCSDSVYESRTRPCLLFQIKRCSAPCTREISLEDYAKLVDEAETFLKGKTDAVQKKLNVLMAEAAEKLEFERAAKYRNRLWALAYIQAHQGINPQGVEEADVFAIVQKGGQTCIQVFFFRNSQNWGNRAYFPRGGGSLSDGEVLGSFISQFYDDKIVPRCVLLSCEVPEQELIAEALSTKLGRKVEVLTPKRGEKRELVDHAAQNAKEALGRKLAESSGQGKLLAAVAEVFGLERTPRRIEVYDNSHIMGTNAVGGMIVAGPEGFVKNQYRKFNIKTEGLTPGDDFGMMREVLTRRFKRLLKEHGLPAGEAVASDGELRPPHSVSLPKGREDASTTGGEETAAYPLSPRGEGWGWRGLTPADGAEPVENEAVPSDEGHYPSLPGRGDALSTAATGPLSHGERAGVRGDSLEEEALTAEPLENGMDDEAEAQGGDVGVWPDLLLIDGGAGQLSATREVLDGLSLHGLAIVGIAKGPDRNAGRERFFMPGKPPFSLPPNDPVLYFVQRLRDEAHRFAIGSHRAKRKKAMSENSLDDIPGIGPSRKRALLRHFGSAKSVSRAGLPDLQAVDGISEAMAQQIYDYFHGGK
jgi:excinuclease ABC subunit C